MSGRPPAIDEFKLQVQKALQEGLPLVAEPYKQLAAELGSSESRVMNCIEELQASGAVKRFGMVLRHRPLGYRANAMVVWDIPDADVDRIGQLLGGEPCVTLSYRRPRRPPQWNYNLFSMIHGKSRETVEQQLADIVERHGLANYSRDILFSTRCFKQRGAVYV
jgi:DNA-binding Lrp family transcriptional regulator